MGALCNTPRVVDVENSLVVVIVELNFPARSALGWRSGLAAVASAKDGMVEKMDLLS